MSGESKPNRFLERLAKGERVLIAEGYLFEMERRCYGKMGSMVPEVLIDEPEKVRQLHDEFVRCGTDVVESYTYYAIPTKLKDIGRDEKEYESMNKTALRMARESADAGGCLMAGAVSNTNLLNPANPATYPQVEAIFDDQVRWAVEAGADYMVCESFLEYAEASLALKVCKKHNIPAVVTYMVVDKSGEKLFDDIPVAEGMRKLEEEGAAVVGANCARGPTTMLPVLKEARKVCKGPLAALPVCYRCNEKATTMQRLKLEDGRSYPENVRAFSCSPLDMEIFAKGCEELGIQYVGLCCGNDPHLFRALAVSFGRNPPAKAFMPDNAEKSSYAGKSTDADNRYTKGVYEFMYL